MENMAKSIALVARDLPSADVLDDLRTFAWEILRRRRDFRGAPAMIQQVGPPSAPIELITPLRASREGMLRFR